MARTVYYAAVSLDGFLSGIAGPGGAEHGFGPAAPGALAMGAETYRCLLSASADGWEFGRIPAWIFTHHEFPPIPGADITFVRGDVAEFHPDIAYDAGEKDIALLGGGNLAAQFMDYGLVDEMVLTLVPVVLGSGRPVLPVRQPAGPAGLVGSRSLGQGLVQLRYRFSGG